MRMSEPLAARDRRAPRTSACAARGVVPARRRHGARGRRRLAGGPARARRSAWSASRAAASRRSGARCCGSSSRPAGGSSSTAATSPAQPRASCGRRGATCRSSSRTRTRRSTRASASSSIIGRPLRIHGTRPARRDPGARARAARARRPRGPSTPTATRTSSPAASASASAIARALALQPEARRRRRAGLRARRLDPGADHQPARGPPGRARADLPVHRPRPRRSCATVRPDRGDVPRQDRRGRARRARLRTRRASVHPGAALGGAGARPATSSARRERIVLRGDVPSPVEPAARLPLPHPLPARDRHLHDRRAAARAARATATSPPATTRATCNRQFYGSPRSGRHGTLNSPCRTRLRARHRRDRARPPPRRPRRGRPPPPRPIHPGVQTFTDGAQCTANFVFTDASNTYIGQAAHCSGTGGKTETNGCDSGSLPVGTPVEVTGASKPGTMVYNSWLTMQAKGETDADTCQYNDLALVKLDPADVAQGQPVDPALGRPERGRHRRRRCATRSTRTATPSCAAASPSSARRRASASATTRAAGRTPSTP